MHGHFACQPVRHLPAWPRCFDFGFGFGCLDLLRLVQLLPVRGRDDISKRGGSLLLCGHLAYFTFYVFCSFGGPFLLGGGEGIRFRWCGLFGLYEIRALLSFGW